MRAGLAGRAFEREDGENGGGSVRRYDAVVIVSRGMMDGCDDEVAGLGNVLRAGLGYRSSSGAEKGCKTSRWTYSSAVALNPYQVLLVVVA